MNKEKKELTDTELGLLGMFLFVKEKGLDFAIRHSLAAECEINNHMGDLTKEDKAYLRKVVHNDAFIALGKDAMNIGTGEGCEGIAKDGEEEVDKSKSLQGKFF